MILDLLEGGLIERGLIREGGLFTKSSDKDIFGSFSVLLSHVLWNQHTNLRLKYINSTQFSYQTISKLTCKVVSLSRWKYLVNSRTLHKLEGGLIERGLISNFDSGEGLIREGGLIERGGLIELLP